MTPRVAYGDPPLLEYAIGADPAERHELIDGLIAQEPDELAAMALHALGYHTPGDVENMIARRDPELLDQWIGSPAAGENARETFARTYSDRHLYRRRVALLRQVLEGKAGAL